MSNIIWAPGTTPHDLSWGQKQSDSNGNVIAASNNDIRYGWKGQTGGTAGSSSSASSGSNSLTSAVKAVDSAANSVGSLLNGIMSGSGGAFADALRESMEIAQGNSAMSQAFAREQMDYQTASNKTAMDWSAVEAQKTRDWQTEMSNTAHQREVKDLMNAGLNPVLSANAGASTPSGATGQAFSSNGAMGDVDNTNPMNMFSSIFTGMINAAMQLKGFEVEENIANRQILSNLELARISGDYNLQGHQISSAATLGAAGAQAAAARYAADIGRQNTLTNSYTNRYGYDTNYKSSIYASDKSAGSKSVLGREYEGLKNVASDLASNPTNNVFNKMANGLKGIVEDFIWNL